MEDKSTFKLDGYWANATGAVDVFVDLGGGGGGVKPSFC